MSYELDWSRPDAYSFSNHAIVGVLTGIPYHEIEAVRAEVWRTTGRKNEKAWYGQSYIHVFRKLGFNVSDRWIKFDPKTDKPCIIRTTSDKKGYWYAWIYDGKLVNNHWTLEEWKKEWEELKITSMLQVWI